MKSVLLRLNIQKYSFSLPEKYKFQAKFLENFQNWPILKK
jgi:hypothetical protein